MRRSAAVEPAEAGELPARSPRASASLIPHGGSRATSRPSGMLCTSIRSKCTLKPRTMWSATRPRWSISSSSPIAVRSSACSARPMWSISSRRPALPAVQVVVPAPLGQRGLRAARARRRSSGCRRARSPHHEPRRRAARLAGLRLRARPPGACARSSGRSRSGRRGSRSAARSASDAASNPPRSASGPRSWNRRGTRARHVLRSCSHWPPAGASHVMVACPRSQPLPRWGRWPRRPAPGSPIHDPSHVLRRQVPVVLHEQRPVRRRHQVQHGTAAGAPRRRRAPPSRPRTPARCSPGASAPCAGATRGRPRWRTAPGRAARSRRAPSITPAVPVS